MWSWFMDTRDRTQRRRIGLQLKREMSRAGTQQKREELIHANGRGWYEHERNWITQTARGVRPKVQMQ